MHKTESGSIIIKLVESKVIDLFNENRSNTVSATRLIYILKFTLTCWDRALKPKSETFRFPAASNSKFSGCKGKIHRA